MIDRFFVLGSQRTRPESQATLFADGSGDSSFRDGVDVELSHWVPNKTPDEYKAGTSTEVCLKFAEKNRDLPKQYDLAMNNHADVDGILSMYALVHSETALKHREVLIQAAEMGDFWGWGKVKARELFLTLTELFLGSEHSGEDLMERYEEAFKWIDRILADKVIPSTAVISGMSHLNRSDEVLCSPDCTIQPWGDHLVSIQFSGTLARVEQAQLLAVAKFNEMITERLLVWPHAINKDFGQKAKLLSVEGVNGWYHDLHYPGYMWADTKDLWRAPGLTVADSTNAFFFGSAEFKAAIRELEESERNPGTWYYPAELRPFSQTVAKRPFPIVSSFLDAAGHPAASILPPNEVARIFSKVLG